MLRPQHAERARQLQRRHRLGLARITGRSVVLRELNPVVRRALATKKPTR